MSTARMISWLTSKMSHACGWRAACRTTAWILWFHFETPSTARGVTDIGVGSGALLGRFCRGRKWLGLKSMIMVNRLDASSLRGGCNLESHLSFETETFLRLRSRAGNFLIAANSRKRAPKKLDVFLIATASHAQRQR